MRRVGVCGLGKLGTPIAVVFAAAGVPTIGYDADARKVFALECWRSPVDETEVDHLLAQADIKRTLRVTRRGAELVSHSDACVFVTQTPSLANGDFDHRVLLEALAYVAAEVRRQNRVDYGFIVASTVMPGFLEGDGSVAINSALKGMRHWLAYKPEFIALGTVIRDLRHPDLLLIGVDEPATAPRVEALYRRIVLNDAPAKRMSLVEAELAKISLNCAVTARISFANQVALLARRLGADPRKVLDAVGSDHRIGHAALQPGLSFGGPCFPRDNRMFARVADRVGTIAPIAHATDAINYLMLVEIIEQIPRDGDVGILGLAYKPGTSITEESAGARLAEILEKQGRTVKTHDVRAPHMSTVEEVCACATVVVACAWPEYADLTLREGSVLFDPAQSVKRCLFSMKPEVLA